MIMNRKLRWISLALVLAATGCAKKERTRVYVLNGLDIPVHVDIQSDGGGDHASFEIAPHGRETPDASGLSTVKVTTAKGDLISEGKAQFGKPKGCLRIYNVVGAAAYVAEDVVYGSGFGTPQRMPRAGEISEELSVRRAQQGDDRGSLRPPWHEPALATLRRRRRLDGRSAVAAR
jgi:hypothetical protein